MIQDLKQQLQSLRIIINEIEKLELGIFAPSVIIMQLDWYSMKNTKRDIQMIAEKIFEKLQEEEKK